MTLLKDAFPELFAELAAALKASDRTDVAEQLRTAIVTGVSFSKKDGCGYVGLKAGRSLNVVEENIIGVRGGTTIGVKTQFWSSIDLDNFDRVVGIEVLETGPLTDEFKRRAAG